MSGTLVLPVRISHATEYTGRASGHNQLFFNVLALPVAAAPRS
jgi:hypothetical protein